VSGQRSQYGIGRDWGVFRSDDGGGVVFVGIDSGRRLDWQVDQVANADVRHDVGGEVLIEASEMSGVPGVGEMNEG